MLPPKRKKRRPVPLKKFSALQAQNALKKITPEYQGWVAAILWYHHSPKGKDSPSPTKDAGWAKFKANHVPTDIPESLSPDTMLQECNKISLPFAIQNATLRTVSQNPTRRDIDPNPRTIPGFDIRPTDEYYSVPSSGKNYNRVSTLS